MIEWSLGEIEELVGLEEGVAGNHDGDGLGTCGAGQKDHGSGGRRKIIEARLPVVLACWRKRVDRMPDAGAGKSINDGRMLFATGAGIYELTASLRSFNHALGGAFLDTSTFTVAPDLRWQNLFVAPVSPPAPIPGAKSRSVHLWE